MPLIVYALDVSISMAKSYSDMTPSKLVASIDSLLTAAKRAVENGWRIGLTLFAGWTLPVIPPTYNYRSFLRALRHVDKAYLGSAPGTAIVESVKLMRFLPDPRKDIVLITDGDYNAGVPVGHAISYARLNGINLHIMLLALPEHTPIASIYEKYREDADWIIVSRKAELDAALLSMVEGEG